MGGKVENSPRTFFLCSIHVQRNCFIFPSIPSSGVARRGRGGPPPLVRKNALTPMEVIWVTPEAHSCTIKKSILKYLMVFLFLKNRGAYGALFFSDRKLFHCFTMGAPASHLNALRGLKISFDSQFRIKNSKAPSAPLSEHCSVSVSALSEHCSTCYDCYLCLWFLKIAAQRILEIMFERNKTKVIQLKLIETSKSQIGQYLNVWKSDFKVHDFYFHSKTWIFHSKIFVNE
jgi:hypothetical protein